RQPGNLKGKLLRRASKVQCEGLGEETLANPYDGRCKSHRQPLSLFVSHYRRYAALMLRPILQEGARRSFRVADTEDQDRSAWQPATMSRREIMHGPQFQVRGLKPENRHRQASDVGASEVHQRRRM